MHAKRSRMLSDALGAKESLCTLDNALNIVRKAGERNRNRLTGERLLIEDYCSGKAEVAFLLRTDAPFPPGKTGGPLNHYAYVAKADIGKSDVWRRGVEILKGQAGDFKKICRGEDESVLVDDIKSMQFLKFEVPSRIRLKRFVKVSDIFAGVVYASATDGLFKNFKVAALADGELPGAFREGLPGFRHEIIAEQVKRGSEVVGSVTYDECELVWDGHLVFGSYASVQALRILVHDGPIMGFEELRRQSIKLVDVVFGPF